MVEMVAFQELARDLVLPPGQRTKVFDMMVPIPAGERLIRLNLQGGSYLNWMNASIPFSLRVEAGILRTTVINPIVTVSPTPGGEIQPASATGTVRFTDLDEGVVIPAGISIQRADTSIGVFYSTQMAVEAIDGVADVPVRASMPGPTGNCPEGTPFIWNNEPGVAIADFSGGADMAPGLGQIVHRIGSLTFAAEHATGPNIQVEVWLTDIAIRAAMPGVPMPAGGWTLMGREGDLNIPTLRWPWRCLIEDLGFWT